MKFHDNLVIWTVNSPPNRKKMLPGQVKCTFSAEGMLPDPTKVESIKNWPIPNDVTTLRQFLGLASYY